MIMMSFLEKNIIFGNMVNDIKRMINIDEDTTSLVGKTTNSSDEAIDKQQDARLKNHKVQTNTSEIIKNRTEKQDADTRERRVDNTEERNKILAADAKNKRIATELANPGRQKNTTGSSPVASSLTQS
jgi:hypothetical protein